MADDSKNKSREEIMKFAFGELQKTLDSIQQGKVPVISNKLKNLLHTLNETYKMVEDKKITEEQMNNVLEETAKKVSKEDK